MATVNDAITRRYQTLGKRLEQKERARTQEEQEALQRRFAAIGGLGSGASIKTQQLAQQAASKRVAEGQEALSLAESQERQRQQEIQEQRAYQTSEREASQTHLSGESALNRALQERGLTLQEGVAMGLINGKKTLSAKTAEEQKALAVAGLTGKYGGEETLAAREARLGRETQAEQWGKTFEESKRQSEVREFLAAKSLAFQKLFEENKVKYQDAVLAWNKFTWDKQFTLDKMVTLDNLRRANEAAENADQGFFEGIVEDVVGKSTWEKISGDSDAGKLAASAVLFPTFAPTTLGYSKAASSPKILSDISKTAFGGLRF